MDQAQVRGYNSNDTQRFFYTGLRKTEAAQPLSQLEALHVASILSHYAQVSSLAPPTALPPPVDLSQVLRPFMVVEDELVCMLDDTELLRIATAQTLFLLGFFSSQMERRHSLKWFESSARAYYVRLSYHSKTPTDRETFLLMSRNFAQWVIACQEFQENLRIERYLIKH